MPKSAIRLEYSGLVIFAAKMVSVATGLGFAIMIARELLPSYRTQYDLWYNINDLTAYFTLIAGVLPFWAMRFAAREKEGSVKTGILANLAISVVPISIYLLLIPFITSALHINVDYLPVYFLMAIGILETYSIVILEACIQARTPQAAGYGLIVQQVLRVVLGYILIIELHLLLLGAVIASLAAVALQTIYYFKLLAPQLKQRIEWAYLKEWLKGSLVNVYSVVGNQIAAYIFIMLFTYGGDGARGRLGACATVVNVITYSSFLAYALYPKLIAERRREDITTSLRMVLMFAIPMTVGAVALSDSYITMLTDTYTDAALVLVVLAIDAFVSVVSGLFSTVLLGVETVDEDARLSLRQLTKSRLFMAFSLSYVHSAITIPTTFYVLTNYAYDQPLQAALYVSIINSVARFAMFILLYAIVRKMIKIDIPWKKIGKYTFAAASMGIILYVVPHPTRIILTVGETAIGGIIYLALLMTIDKEARNLPKLVLQEIRHKTTKERGQPSSNNSAKK